MLDSRRRKKKMGGRIEEPKSGRKSNGQKKNIYKCNEKEIFRLPVNPASFNALTVRRTCSMHGLKQHIRVTRSFCFGRKRREEKEVKVRNNVR